MLQRFLARVTPTVVKSYSIDKQKGLVTREQILALPSTPLASPSYPRGPYTFINREYFIISYESDAELVRKVIPQPLRPAPPGNVVLYEWIRMPDSTGFGDYEESGTVIPCITPDGEQVNFVSQMFLDCEPPIAAGREIWGFPKKYANPKLAVLRDTVYGKLDYMGTEVANGTMAYKYKAIPRQEAIKSLSKPAVNLKLIPDVDFKLKIAQLVKYQLIVENFKFAYEGPARLNLAQHINAPTGALPVRRVISGKHFLADIILPYGNVIHDYLDDDMPQPEDDPLALSRSQILGSGHAMPFLAPSYMLEPSMLNDREYFIIKYQTDIEAIQALIPDMFYPASDEGIVYVQWVKTNGTGLGDYDKFDVLVPVRDQHGTLYNFAVMSFLDSSSPITAGREQLGQPQKYGHPNFKVERDTVTGELKYCNIKVATGTMRYKNRKMPKDVAEAYLTIPHMNLKIIPDVNGNVQIAQLVEVKYENVNVTSAFESPANLELYAHANAPVADLPVRHVIGGFSMRTSMVLPQGKVYHDYLKL
jgi:acetoacetate decarboxylase